MLVFMNGLPEKFLERMKARLGAEYGDYLAALDAPPVKGLHINTARCAVSVADGALPGLEKLPFGDGCRLVAEGRPTAHPYYAAGLYYMQEPSAMLPVSALAGLLPDGARVLDMCAAPGGKTSMLARMPETGLLVSNEIERSRALVLRENVVRMGYANVLAVSMRPDRAADAFGGFFDAAVVDAPCSGEGMFRKNEQACEEWSPENVQICAARQQEILACAASMLRPGGRMVYSTCTFAPEENEGTISRFLEQHPQFHIVPVKKYPGMADGVAAWTKHPAAEIGDTIRLFPHHLHGEGHFVAVLEKEGTVSENYRGYCANGEEKPLAKGEAKAYLAGLQEFLGKIPADDAGRLLLFGEQLYLMPEHMPATRRLHVLRPGLHLGTVKKNRLEPAHALALAISPQEACHSWNLSVDEARAYLAGQTFPAEGEKGWYLITVDGYSLGWGKLAGSVMKNHYPKGLRKLL